MSVSRISNTQATSYVAIADLQAKVKRLETRLDGAHEAMVALAKQLRDERQQMRADLQAVIAGCNAGIKEAKATAAAAAARQPTHPPEEGDGEAPPTQPEIKASKINTPQAIIPAVQTIARDLRRLWKRVDRVAAKQPTHPPEGDGEPSELVADCMHRINKAADWAAEQHRLVKHIDDRLTRLEAQQQRWYLSQRGAKGADFAQTHVPPRPQF